jgi:hypothetical protein
MPDGGEVAREMVTQLFLNSLIELAKEGLPEPGLSVDEANAIDLDALKAKSFMEGFITPLTKRANAAGVNLGVPSTKKEILDTGRGFGSEDVEILLNILLSGGDLKDKSSVRSIPATLMHEALHSLANQQGEHKTIEAFDQLVRTGQAKKEDLVPPLISSKGMSMEDFEILAGIVRLFEDKMG